jgi:hypothetical protein
MTRGSGSVQHTQRAPALDHVLLGRSRSCGENALVTCDAGGGPANKRVGVLVETVKDMHFVRIGLAQNAEQRCAASRMRRQDQSPGAQAADAEQRSQALESETNKLLKTFVFGEGGKTVPSAAVTAEEVATRQ